MTKWLAIGHRYAIGGRRSWLIAAASLIISLAVVSGVWLTLGGGSGTVQAQAACETGGATPDGGGLARDCSTLLGLKSQLAGTATLNWSTDLAIASWDGVRVGGSPKRVTRLHLHAKGLTGTVPADLSRLDELRHLNLERNQLTGSIPGELGQLGEMTNLALGQNKLTGAIPAELAKMAKLGSLYLRYNQLTGTLPEGLGTSDALWLVSVDQNRLTGALPASLSGLSVLWASGNKWSCAPPALLKVQNNDLAGLNLSECAEATATRTPTPSATATATPTGTPAPTATATPGESEPPSLIVISDGAHDSLILEWTGGPANATKWQYRQRPWDDGLPLAWEQWTDIRGSGAATRSHRVSGLGSLSGFEYQVRAVVGTVAGAESEADRGGTQEKGSKILDIYLSRVVEGDGRSQWRVVNFTIVIPDGMRLHAGVPFAASDGRSGSPVYDVGGGGGLTFGDDGEVLVRYVAPVAPADASVDGNAQAKPPRDVGALLDQIIDSIREYR